jgi:peptidoglycan/xylan/chitin deacetylase (PgdA/CDA1 family)
MRYLAARGYRSVTLSDLCLGTLPALRRQFVLTFDDGYVDTYVKAYPVLRQHNIQATIFLVSEWLGKGNLKAPAEMLSRSQILEMSKHGMAFGSHGRSHRALTELTVEEIWDEVEGSKRNLETAIGLPVTCFAYPFGLSDSRTRQVVRECGYDLAVAVANGSEDRYNLRRTVILMRDSLMQFAWKVSGWRSYLRSLRHTSPAT